MERLDCAEVRSIEGMIRWNDANPRKRTQLSDLRDDADYSGQDVLLACQGNQIDATTAESLWGKAQSIGRELGIDKALNDLEIDVILAPSDSTFSQLVSAAGYPSATMPLSYLEYNGRPFGVSVFSTAYTEPTLVKVLSAWEKTFGPRQPPRMRFGQQATSKV
ncbi:hypothetical protein N8I77_010948 [Diaporthe amygdali]|uniref:Amidase domain-containing protein n=1 Tax=Phomopsis amygdali TaxID=1214568 RepID=A0AAD9S9L0_PHOAM|nr:hypothetical protein N8I77_010948 [Diaporthe amygdali]